MLKLCVHKTRFGKSGHIYSFACGKVWHIKIFNTHQKGVGIDSTIKSTETRILLAQFILQKFNPYKDPSGTV